MPSDPGRSLLLTKPTGLLSHKGGVKLDPDVGKGNAPPPPSRRVSGERSAENDTARSEYGSLSSDLWAEKTDYGIPVCVGRGDSLISAMRVRTPGHHWYDSIYHPSTDQLVS